MKTLRPHRPSPALVVATVALIVALGGTAYAGLSIPKNSVGTKQLKNGAVTTKKNKNGTVTAKKINTSGLTVPGALHANTADSATDANFASTAGGAPPTSSAGGALSGTFPDPGLASLPPITPITTFVNGWKNLGSEDDPAGYYKDALGIVHLTGAIDGGTVPGYAFTLPSGYRGVGYFASGSSDDDETSKGPCTVFLSLVGGDVFVDAGCDNAEVGLDGITFRPVG
jgi:hypothetical protein